MDANGSRKALAEFIGTFAFVFIGAGSILANEWSQGEVGLLGVALAHGLALAVIISFTGHISGGHINPAVTVAVAATGRMRSPLALAYIVAQLLGATLGALLLRAVFPAAIWSAASLGTPMLSEGVGLGAGLLLEAVLTFILVTAIYGTVIDPSGPAQLAGFGIGTVVIFDVLVGGLLTGASMNPARTFGPALAGGFWADHLVYWIGPIAGALVAAFMFDHLLGSKARSRTAS